MSSVYSLAFDVVSLVISLMYINNKIVSRIVLWGVPDVTGDHSEQVEVFHVLQHVAVDALESLSQQTTINNITTQF